MLHVFGVGVSCHILCSFVSYLYVGCGGLSASMAGVLICLLSFTCGCKVSGRGW